MIESILRSIEKGTFVLKENKKKSEEIYIRIRLESGEIVKVNKCKDRSKRILKEDEFVIFEFSNIIDIRNSDDKSLFNKKIESQSNTLNSGIKKNETNIGFRFTIHHGLQFNLKLHSFRGIFANQ